MRICLLTKEYPPDTGWGGIGAYNYQIARGLKEIGHDVEVVALAKDKHTSSDGAVNQDGITIHRATWAKGIEELNLILVTMPTSHFVLKTNLALWKKFIEVHQKNPFDIVEAPEHLAEGLLPAVTKSVPVIIKLHTPYSKFITERFHNVSLSFDHQFIAMLERMAMLSADLLISPSENLAQYVSQDMNYPLESIKIVRNPVDATKFCPEGNIAIESDGRATVLFVGRLEDRKGIHYLIDAIPQIVKTYPNVRFLIVGSDTETAHGKKMVLPQLQEKLAKSNCTKYVTFIPQVKLSDMPAYYRSADICIAPSLYDNAPYTCLEAMATGKAFIGTAAGGMPEYVEHGKSGLIIPPADSGAITQAIEQLLQNKEQRESLGKEARKYILENIHFTQIAKENIKMYQLATEKFKSRSGSSLYMRGDEQSIKDISNLLFIYHKMLCNVLYQQSWRWRMKHWFGFLISRPRLFGARILSRFTPKFKKAGIALNLINNFENHVSIKEQERELELRERSTIIN